MTKTQRQLNVLLTEIRGKQPRALEMLSTELISRLVGVRLSVALGGGFQHGGDGGTTGRANRHLRIECKRYADNTPLSDRELQGEIDDARRRTPGLEAWILVSTKEVSENTQETLNLKAREIGIPVIVLDWSASGDLPDLAAVCAWAPDLVRRHYGTKAWHAAKALTPFATATVERFARELENWKLGYENLRTAAADRIRAIWQSESESRAALAQNVAGGAASVLVERKTALAALRKWWLEADGRLAIVHGAEGVGKTWSIMQWVLHELNDLPLALTVPSSAVHDVKANTEGGILEFIGGCLFDIARTQNRQFWQARVHQLFQRPSEEGPVMLLMIDGANQEPSFQWRRFVQILEAGCFKGRLRLIISVQTHFLEERLHKLRGTTSGVCLVGVEPYDIAPGGELEQLLTRHGRTLDSIAPDLLPMARTPRLFPLVMKLSSRANVEGDVTLPRLLWAHGRDELSLREERAFSETEWESWLLRLAESHWTKIQSHGTDTQAVHSYSIEELDAMVARQSYDPSLNARRLAEIIDGTWMEPSPGRPGHFRPRESTINLALGAAVLGLLEEEECQEAGNVELVLTRWLDPIAATTAAADILANAMSIGVAKQLPSSSSIPGAIVTALLQSQNVSDSHRKQAAALAPALPQALMDAVERSSSRAQASARHWALEALESISTENEALWRSIVPRLVAWVAHVDCPSASQVANNDDAGKHQAKLLTDRIGTYAAGTRLVMGVPLVLREIDHEDLAMHIPSLLIAKPLELFLPVFAAAAVTAAVSMNLTVWNGLKWLVSLNPIDADKTIESLVELSTIALQVPGGDGVHLELPTRVSALLLWLTGVEKHERKAADMRVSFEKGLSYEENYLSNPTRSLFGPIEHRHLGLLWRDDGLALSRRLQMATAYLPDPTLQVPIEFIEQVKATADAFPVEKLDTRMGYTAEDHEFERLQLGLARLAPQALAELVQRWFGGLPRHAQDSRHWAALRMTRHLLLAAEPEVACVKAMRLNRPHPTDADEKFLAMSMLELELLNLELDAQLDALVEAEDAFLSLKLLEVLRTPTSSTIPRFIRRWSCQNRRALEVLFNYLAHHPVPLERELFEALSIYAFPETEDDDLKTLAFLGLARANPNWFGELLIERNWAACLADNYSVQDEGSCAIFLARPNGPLKDLSSRVAPWRLLREASIRGGTVRDAKLAADVLSEAIFANGFEPSHPMVDISIDVSKEHGWVSFDPPARNPQDETSIREAFDTNAQRQRQQIARDEGRNFMHRARSAGAHLATVHVNVVDARMLVAHCSAEVDLWIEGSDERTQAFRDRVNRAGGLFLSLCEVLLDVDWRRGVNLWRALEQSLTINFVGRAGLSELKLMLFRSTESPGVLALRDEVFSLSRNLTDSSYVEIALCALLNKNEHWLRRRIEADALSGVTLRKKRAVLLQGLIASDVAAPSWTAGYSIGGMDWLRRRAQSWKNSSAFARHWWRQFLQVKNLAEAYAAWCVFLHCVDRTAMTWMDQDLAEFCGSDDLWRIKMLHLEINWSNLERSMNKKEFSGQDPMARHLFGWDNPEGWFSAEQLAQIGY